MLSSICAIRRCILAAVKFLSRLFTALNLLPSMATIASVNRSSLRHSTMNWRHTLDRGPIVLAEVSNGLEVRHQTSSQPHELDVALRLALQTAARLNAIEITVDVNRQQRGGMVRRTARCRPIDTFKSECRKIELVNKDLNHTDRVVLGDVVIQAFRQQRDLRSVLT